MILHSVYCNFRDDVCGEERTQIFKDLSALCQTVDGFMAFDYGPNRDFEKKSQIYSDGFVIRFDSQHALEVYAKHPTHMQLGQRLCSLCVGGADGLIVFDLEVDPTT